MFRQFDEPNDTFSRGPTQYLLAAAVQRQGINSCINGLLGENVVGELPWAPGLQMIAKRSPETAGDGRGQISQAIDELTIGVPGNSDFEAYMNFSVLLGRTANLSIASQAIPVLQGVAERSAFSDRKLWEFVQSIPADLKRSDTSNGRKRALLTSAFQQQLPAGSQEQVHRQEKGTYPGVPWQAQPWFEKLVLRQAKRTASQGLIQPQAVEKILRKYKNRRAKRDKKNVSHLFVLQTWLDFHLNGIDPFREPSDSTPLPSTFA